jgi:RalA-binding protein 1
LGSITITGAQIGRQQRSGDRREMDEEKEYRHAFLIIEAKKGPSNSHRHVLCAESDEDRDSWVEELVRYVMGSYNEESAAQSGPSISTSSTVLQGRSSTSSNSTYESSATGRRPLRGLSKDDIPKGPGMEIIAKGPAVPLSQLSQDASNAKLFQTANIVVGDSRDSSPSKSDTSPVERLPSTAHSQISTERSQLTSSEAGLSSSLPTTSPLEGSVAELVGSSSQRSNSEMGNYTDMQTYAVNSHLSPERHRTREKPVDSRKSYHPAPPTSTQDRAPTPEQGTPARGASNGKVKISGPMGGTPIPEGYKFGGKEAPLEGAGSSKDDRKEKAKSRSFWGFGKGNGKLFSSCFALSHRTSCDYRETTCTYSVLYPSICVWRDIRGISGRCSNSQPSCHCLPLYPVSGSQESGSRRRYL